MATLSCRERRFELELAPRLDHQYRYYLLVLRNLLQRLGREHTLTLWRDVFRAHEFVRASDTEVVTRVTECEWARYYQEHHPRVGYLLACCLDNAVYQSLNPRLRLQRTSTLMEGGPACDFRVYALEQAPGDTEMESSP